MSDYRYGDLSYVDAFKEIRVASGVDSVNIADVYLSAVDWASEPENMVYDNPVTGGGLFPLDDVGEAFTGLVVRMDLVSDPPGGGNTWRVKFADAPGPDVEARRLFGGDFLAEGAGNLPAANSANVMPIIELATSRTLVKVATGGLGEADKDDIAGRVWDRVLSAHTTSGTFGEYVQRKLLSVAKFLALK